MSMLQEILKRHKEELQELRDSCNHFLRDLKIISVGDHSKYTRVICQNCGFDKRLFGMTTLEVKNELKERGTLNG
jgi:predicted nucleic-acid-binding Zn-ribbon protein